MDQANPEGTVDLAAANPETVAATNFPTMVKLTHPHGFIEEETGRHRFWKAGDVVADPSEVMLLINRGAPIEFVD